MAGFPNYLVEDLRHYLVDETEFNHLNIHEEELLDEKYIKAVYDGANTYDLIPPVSTTDVTTFLKAELVGTSANAASWYFIKRFAALEIIQMLIFIHTRNRNRVSDQGLIVDEYSKADDWKSLRKSLMEEWKRDVRELKRVFEYRSFGSGSALTVTLNRLPSEMT